MPSFPEFGNLTAKAYFKKTQLLLPHLRARDPIFVYSQYGRRFGGAEAAASGT